MTAKLGGHTISAAKLQIPAWGKAWADVELTEPVVLTGAQTLTIADATYAMTITSGGITEAGRARYRLVAGNGGWGRTIAKKAYQNDAGVTKAMLARDAATACGEVLGTPPTGRMGSHYMRKGSAPASAVLNIIAPRAWYVDVAGVTQFGQRETAAYTGQGARMRRDLAAGVVELAVDEIGNLAPGVTVDGMPAATDVEIEVDPKRLTVRVYWAPQAGRRVTAIGKIVEALFPWLHYCATYEFRVVTQTGNRLNLQPVRVASGMNDLALVPVRPGVAGTKSQHTLGSLVLVTFADHDPSRPQVTSFDDPDSPGWMPSMTDYGEGDFLAQKTAIDNLQAKLDDLILKYNTAVYPTGVGPSGTTSTPETVLGVQASCTKLRGE